MNLKTVAGGVYPFLRKRQVFCTGNDEKSEGQPLFVEPDFVKQSPAIFFEMRNRVQGQTIQAANGVQKTVRRFFIAKSVRGGGGNDQIIKQTEEEEP